MYDFAVSPDLDLALEELIDTPVHPDSIVLVTESHLFPGCLAFDVVQDVRQEFFTSYAKWMSRHLVLNELFSLGPLSDKLTEDGFHLVFDSSTETILADYHRWSRPLDIAGYTLEDYQTFSMNKALDRHHYGEDNGDRFFFWNWSAGAGKSFCSGAALKRLFEENTIDVAIVCTLSDLKINLGRFLATSGLDVVVNDGDKDRRTKRYEDRHQVYVMNFEKLNFDRAQLSALTAERRVAFVLDEAHKLIAESGQNKAREGLESLVRGCEATVWPMTATAVGGSPLKYRDVFSLDGWSSHNPLSTKKDFVAAYAKKVINKPAKTRSGGHFMMTSYEWNTAKLQEVRHRVQDRCMAVRRESDMVTLPYPIQGSKELHTVFDCIIDLAKVAIANDELPVSHYRLLRQVAVHPGVLAVSQDPLAQLINLSHPEFALVPSPKIAALNGLLEEIREAGDQAVCFVHWTTGGLHLLADALTVPHVKHWGTGQSQKASQKAVDDFKANGDITCFLSSDAGSHGLSFQNARYVINIDPVYDFDLLTQRNKRIDRMDSHLDGLTAYVMYVEDSVEERVHRACDLRRKLSATTQGTVEQMSPEEIALANSPEELLMDWTLFGN